MIVTLLFGACCFTTGVAVMILAYGNLMTAHPGHPNSRPCNCGCPYCAYRECPSSVPVSPDPPP